MVTFQGQQLLEGGDYSRAAPIQRNTVYMHQQRRTQSMYMYNVYIKIHVTKIAGMICHTCMPYILHLATDILMHVLMHSWTN